MTATQHRRIATALAVVLSLGVVGLAGGAPAGATPTSFATCQQACAAGVPATLDWGVWTARDGAPRYRIDGIGFSEGKVRVVVQNEAGKVLWSKSVPTSYDPGLPEPVFHVGTAVRCDHRVRHVQAQDLVSGEWTQRYTLDPCIL